MGTTGLQICKKGGRLDGDCNQCKDGYLCTFLDERVASVGWWSGLKCAGPEYGVLLSLNGKTDWIRYADRSTYLGAPLPEPTTCPSIPGMNLCGGSCGSCPADYVCVGRSPLHPYSLCVNAAGKPNVLSNCERKFGCDAGRKCLTFKVDGAAQPIADAHGVCVDAAICDAAATSYPGGAFCGP